MLGHAGYGGDWSDESFGQDAEISNMDGHAPILACLPAPSFLQYKLKYAFDAGGGRAVYMRYSKVRFLPIGGTVPVPYPAAVAAAAHWLGSTGPSLPIYSLVGLVTLITDAKVSRVKVRSLQAPPGIRKSIDGHGIHQALSPKIP